MLREPTSASEARVSPCLRSKMADDYYESVYKELTFYYLTFVSFLISQNSSVPPTRRHRSTFRASRQIDETGYGQLDVFYELFYFE